MIKSLASATCYATVVWGTTGEVGTLNVTVYDNQGAVSVPRTIDGISEIATGVYMATFTAPSTDGQYSVVFDDTVLFLNEDLFVGEDVEDESAVLARDTIELTADWNETGLAGTLAVTIYDSAGTVVASRSTAGLVEVTDGIYAATRVAPSAAGRYAVVWDDGTEFTAETLTVIPLVEGKTFGDLIDLVQLGRFEDADRDRIKEALNLRYQHLWAVEEWTFKYKLSAPVTVSGQRELDPPADLGTPIMLWDDAGRKLVFMAQREFLSRYLPEAQGGPEAWTMIGSEITLGPTPDSAVAFTLYYEARVPDLVDEDEDMPDWPEEFRMALVHSARAEMLAVNDDPNATNMEQQAQLDLEAMKRRYLADAIGEPAYWPSDTGCY